MAKEFIYKVTNKNYKAAGGVYHASTAAQAINKAWSQDYSISRADFSAKKIGVFGSAIKPKKSKKMPTKKRKTTKRKVSSKKPLSKSDFSKLSAKGKKTVSALAKRRKSTTKKKKSTRRKSAW